MPTEIDLYSLSTVPVMTFFDNTALGNATAFVWRRDDQSYLVTNWHVVTGRNNETGDNLNQQGGRPNRLQLWFNTPNMAFGKHEAYQELYLPSGKPNWLVHPVHGHAVDVVAIPLPEQPNHLNFWPINQMKSEALQQSIGMDVFILGYPFGFQQPGFPIWKRGSIASEPNIAPLADRYLLVDSASRPGMSGSPVIMRSWGQHMFENGDMITMPGDMATRLVGVYSGRLHTNDAQDAQLARVWPIRLLEEIVTTPTYDTVE